MIKSHAEPRRNLSCQTSRLESFVEIMHGAEAMTTAGGPRAAATARRPADQLKQAQTILAAPKAAP
jgi:hypothetical protein